MNIEESLGVLTDTSLKTLKQILLVGVSHISSEDIAKSVGLDGKTLGSTLSALSKQFVDSNQFISPFGKKSMSVSRVRNGKTVTISMPIQIWKVNEVLLERKEELIKKIDQILAVLNSL